METTSTIATLRQLLDHQTGKFTNGELQLQKNLPVWINDTGSVQLRQVLQKYLDQLNVHIQQMDAFILEAQIISANRADPVMQSLTDETNEILGICRDIQVRDACLLACIQVINHYKISAYGTAAAFAGDLDLEKAAAIFYQMEINEKNIDDRLTQLAKYEINKEAKSPIQIPE
ncbi:ferritin-like domain-containing protein [Mucilaginibacter sp. AW1-7]|uniref:YciE/YciF ferroxidase family protein n=1 Tax=Mucilaginibacter sp. AW1-7 TaxID=3349874 RepID=UPI003F733AF7